MIPKELQNMKPMTGKDRLGAMRDSEYLGVEDIEPGTEPVLTIKNLYNGMITLARGKERHDVIAFAEESVPGSIKQVRPLVVNATNRKTLRKLYKSVTAETLVGKKIKLYIDPTVRNPSTGEKDGGIRIKDKIPTSTATAPTEYKCADCGNVITGIGDYSAEQVAKMNFSRFGKQICGACSTKLKEAQEKAKTEPEQVENSLADALAAEAAE
jgi:DNA-directed RNA polymerase subunit RPC12/RpoP